jgi:hypothetical protein
MALLFSCDLLDKLGNGSDDTDEPDNTSQDEYIYSSRVDVIMGHLLDFNPGYYVDENQNVFTIDFRTNDQDASASVSTTIEHWAGAFNMNIAGLVPDDGDMEQAGEVFIGGEIEISNPTAKICRTADMIIKYKGEQVATMDGTCRGFDYYTPIRFLYCNDYCDITGRIEQEFQNSEGYTSTRNRGYELHLEPGWNVVTEDTEPDGWVSYMRSVAQEYYTGSSPEKTLQEFNMADASYMPYNKQGDTQPVKFIGGQTVNKPEYRYSTYRISSPGRDAEISDSGYFTITGLDRVVLWNMWNDEPWGALSEIFPNCSYSNPEARVYMPYIMSLSSKDTYDTGYIECSYEQRKETSDGTEDMRLLLIYSSAPCVITGQGSNKTYLNLARGYNLALETTKYSYVDSKYTYTHTSLNLIAPLYDGTFPSSEQLKELGGLQWYFRH